MYLIGDIELLKRIADYWIRQKVAYLTTLNEIVTKWNKALFCAEVQLGVIYSTNR